MLFTNDYIESSIQKTFEQMWNDQDFVDVTLATMDGKQLDVHKVLISAASPFFKHILKSNPHQKPLIYLKDIGYNELLLVMKFIYLGQCEVENDKLEEFLATSKELDINGLNNDLEISEADILKSPKIVTEHDNDRNTIIDGTHPIAYIHEEEAETKHIITDDKQKSKYDNIPHIEENLKYGYPCPKCGKSYERLGALKLHIQNKCGKTELKTMLYTKPHLCKLCDRTFQSSQSLDAHVRKSVAHANRIPIFCDLCPEIRYVQSMMEAHMRSSHVSVKCDKCEETVDGAKNLKRHRDSRHHIRTIINYTCPICGEFVKFSHRLKDHNKKHLEYQILKEKCND